MTVAEATTTIYTARAVITMDAAVPRVEAVAVRAGRILAVGSLAEVVARVGPGHVVDDRFSDRIVMPGLIDQHLHPVLAATTLTTEVIAPERWVMPTRTFEAAPDGETYWRLLAETHERLDPGTWLWSWGYHQLWHGKLHRADLDEMCGDRPVAIWQRACHEWHLNSAALEAIGARPETFTNRGFMSEQLDYEAGHFWENGAFVLLSPLLMPHFATASRYREGLAQMIDYLHMNGVTGINEPGIAWAIEPWEVYQEVLGADDVPFMSTFMIDGRNQSVKGIPDEQLVADSERRIASVTQTDKVHVVPGQVKLFCDGAGISQLMQMTGGYLDSDGRPNPDHHGEWLMEPQELRRVFDVYWDAGWQIHIHVNGDAGVEVLLDVLADAQVRHPRTDHRMVFVHFMNSTDDQIARIAELGGIVSINPYYPIGFTEKFSQVGLGRERAEVMSRSGSVVRAGISLSYHSDLPMCPSDPMAMAGWGAGRLTRDGRVVGPEQRISTHEALKAVTIGAAYSWRRDHDLGSIVTGKIANFTVLDDDPYEVDPTRLGSIPVLGTLFQGQWFPVPDHLIERRVEHAPNSTELNPGGLGAHDEQKCMHQVCGCEVAAFMARHMGRDGWAA